MSLSSEDPEDLQPRVARGSFLRVLRKKRKPGDPAEVRSDDTTAKTVLHSEWDHSNVPE